MIRSLSFAALAASRDLFHSYAADKCALSPLSFNSVFCAYYVAALAFLSYELLIRSYASSILLTRLERPRASILLTLATRL